MWILNTSFKRLSIPLFLGLEGSSSAAFAIQRKPCRVLQQQQSFIVDKNCLVRGGAQQSLPETTLPLDFPRRDDVLIALDAVRQACRVCQTLQPTGNIPGEEEQEEGIQTVEKGDLSPVTVADFAVQALILHILHTEFPLDGFIAEEDSAALLEDDVLMDQVLSATGLQEKEDMLLGLDLGKSYTKWVDEGRNTNNNNNNNLRPSRVWCLDPIDGTRGFLRGKRNGGQYAVALALVEDGQPVIGILGCPNLPIAVNDEQYAWRVDETETKNSKSRGCIFVASRGGGCFQLPMVSSLQTWSPNKLEVTTNDGSERSVEDGRFCIGVEKFSDALGQTAGMAKVLHGPHTALDEEGEIIRARRIDSQAKHGVIARGGAEWYVRLPKPGYVEWIWDHAAGNVVIEEAGGKMTDTNGQPIDFSLGAKLSPSIRGILMSNGGRFHDALVDAFAQEEAVRIQKLKSE